MTTHPRSNNKNSNRQNVTHTIPDTILSEAISALLGGAFSSACLYPLEVVKTKMASVDKTDEDEDGDSATKSLSMISYARNLYRSQGGSIFFSGWEVSAFQSAIEKALYFFAFTAFKSMYQRSIRRRSSLPSSSSQFDSRSQKLSTMTTLLFGCLAEWAHLPITLPIDAVTTVIQTRKKHSTTANGENTGESGGGNITSRATEGHHAMTILLMILRNKTMYKGIEAYFLLCFRPAIQYTVFERVKAFILKTRQRRLEKNIRSGSNSSTPPAALSSGSSLPATEAFVLGMIARAVATLVIFPFQRAKVRLQSSAWCHESKPPEDDDTESIGDGNDSSTFRAATTRTTNSIWHMVEQTYHEQGIGGLYQGLGPELTRGVLSAALMMMVKERMSESVKTVLYNSRFQEQAKQQLK